jgi:hypothetical protein
VCVSVCLFVCVCVWSSSEAEGASLISNKCARKGELQNKNQFRILLELLRGVAEGASLISDGCKDYLLVLLKICVRILELCPCSLHRCKNYVPVSRVCVCVCVYTHTHTFTYNTLTTTLLLLLL